LCSRCPAFVALCCAAHRVRAPKVPPPCSSLMFWSLRPSQGGSGAHRPPGAVCPPPCRSPTCCPVFATLCCPTQLCSSSTQQQPPIFSSAAHPVSHVAAAVRGTYPPGAALSPSTLRSSRCSSSSTEPVFIVLPAATCICRPAPHSLSFTLKLLLAAWHTVAQPPASATARLPLECLPRRPLTVRALCSFRLSILLLPMAWLGRQRLS